MKNDNTVADIIVTALISGLIGFILGSKRKKTDASVTPATKTCKKCDREAESASDYCSDHWWYQTSKQ